MKDFKLTDLCDIEINAQNDFATLEGSDELAQALSNILSTGLSEWFLDNILGANWFDILGSNAIDEASFNLVVIEALSYNVSVQTVTNITYDFDRANRKLKITADVNVGDEILNIEVEVT